jgi:hypothetical protein
MEVTVDRATDRRSSATVPMEFQRRSNGVVAGHRTCSLAPSPKECDDLLSARRCHRGLPCHPDF